MKARLVRLRDRIVRLLRSKGATERRLLVVNGHPDPSPERFCAALCDSYAQGAQAAGSLVKRLDAASVDTGHRQVATTLDDAISTIGWASELAVIFPLWLGGLPTALDQLFRHNMRKNQHFCADDRRLHTIVVMDLPAFFLRDGSTELCTNLRLAGFEKHTQQLVGSASSLTERQRTDWLHALREQARRANNR